MVYWQVQGSPEFIAGDVLMCSDVGAVIKIIVGIGFCVLNNVHQLSTCKFVKQEFRNIGRHNTSPERRLSPPVFGNYLCG